MKRIAVGIATLALLATPLVASAASKTATVKKASTTQSSYSQVYCYPTGSYWQAQRQAYPDYYAANDAYYRSVYGPGTYYCQ